MSLLDQGSLSQLKQALLELGPASSWGHARPAASPSLSGDELAMMRRVSPLLEPMYLMIVADCEVDEVEEEVFLGAARALSGGALKRPAIRVMLATFKQQVQAQGRLERLEDVANSLALDRDEAETAFTLAAVAATADHALKPSETALLDQLAKWLSISERRQAELLGHVQSV